MNSKIITCFITLLLFSLVSGCVRAPAKAKQPVIKKVILVDLTTQATKGLYFS